MPMLARLISSLILVAAVSPALAGNFGAVRGPLNGGVLAPADNCPYERALTILDGNGMVVVANVPRTKASYRFVVDYKDETFAVTVGTNDCGIDIVDYARAIEPYCRYVPGLRPSCPQDQQLAQ